MKKHHIVIATSTLVAAAIGVTLILRPSRNISRRSEIGTPESIPPAARAVIRSKMQVHREQMAELVMRVVVLDYDGVARAGGAIFDEPTLARPIGGDELNGVLPERFFVLQDQLRTQARRVVAAAARKDGARVATEFSVLAKTCITCHDLYLHGPGSEAATTPDGG